MAQIAQISNNFQWQIVSKKNVHLLLPFIWCYQLCSAETDNIKRCFGTVSNSVKLLQSQQTTASNLCKSSFETQCFYSLCHFNCGQTNWWSKLRLFCFCIFCCFRKFKEPNITFFIFHWFLPKSCLDKYFALVIFFLLFYCCIAKSPLHFKSTLKDLWQINWVQYKCIPLLLDNRRVYMFFLSIKGW